MQAFSLLLRRPWEYETDALHHGRTNWKDRDVA
jgi:hypothetical protein